MKKRILIISLSILFVLIILTGISMYQSETKIVVTRYEVEADLEERIRIVQLTDLHGKVFGEDNSALVQLVQEQEPDLILMTGDMMDRKDENADVACDLISQLTQTAPIYYGYGNHEYTWMENHEASLTPDLTQAGAVVLDVEYLDVTVNGQQLRIGGYHGYYRQPGMFQATEEQREAELAFAQAFEDTDRYKILLSHIPTAWLDWGYIDDFPVDLVLCGHYHGGQIRLPLIGGLYAPYVGWFPEYTRGMFEGEQAACILSSGLGSSPGIPRVNNLPEIVVVDLIPENS